MLSTTMVAAYHARLFDMSSDFLWWKDPLIITTIATAVIAVATVVNLLVAIFMWRVTRESTRITRSIFEAANRPYVGIPNVNVQKDDAAKKLDFTVRIKNFGSVPANEFSSKWDVLIDGVSQPQTGIPDKPAVLFPQVSVLLAGTFADPMYSSIVTGKSALEFVVKVRYKGVTQKEYYYRQKNRYYPQANSFMVIEAQIQ